MLNNKKIYTTSKTTPTMVGPFVIITGITP